MILQQVIDEVIKNREYKSICIKIAGSKDLGEELYQNFFLSLYQIKEEQFKKAQENNYLKWMLVRVIQNLNLQRYSKYCNENNGMCLLVNKWDEMPGEKIDYIINREAEEEQKEFIIKFKEDFERIKQSPSTRDEYADCLFLEAYMDYSNLSKLSRATGINYQTCKKRLNKIREKYNGN